MWRTTDGETVETKMKKFRRMEEESGPLNVEMLFSLSSESSEWYRDEELVVDVKIDTIWVTLTCEDNTIKLPTMQYGTLIYMIENAAEILLFEAGIKVE